MGEKFIKLEINAHLTLPGKKSPSLLAAAPLLCDRLAFLLGGANDDMINRKLLQLGSFSENNLSLCVTLCVVTGFPSHAERTGTEIT